MQPERLAAINDVQAVDETGGYRRLKKTPNRYVDTTFGRITLWRRGYRRRCKMQKTVYRVRSREDHEAEVAPANPLRSPPPKRPSASRSMRLLSSD